MIELKGLEYWARGILATPTEELNRRLRSSEGWDEIEKSIRELPFFSNYRPIFRSISASTLLELHQKLRGQKCETKFWVLMLVHLDHALPDEIALDLIGRHSFDNRIISALGHSRQSDEVMWKLAPLVDEALLTLAKSFYTDADRTLGELETALRQFPEHEWMLESLGHCAASSLEKRDAYEKAIEYRPEREKWLGMNPKIQPTPQHVSYFDLNRLAETARISALYGESNALNLLDIARDDQTPDVILRELEELRSFPGAMQIRAVARHTLRRRENASLE